ncbi:hypothetical protein [Massilia genomosp. 1]|uniref:Uncharacterized protein n=1 Tax=Massilia genomosp. 1 TaxID=2609280 RepID=A0ABX0MFK6_9BURK|nr:hypothetical protein [Massilia genomosp. 1]NHZ61106.1 hypothetical protein [Massilia genomosp. 1]
MNRSIYPMAYWTYEFVPFDSPRSGDPAADFTQFLGQLDPCIALLSERELFIPSQIQCLNWWASGPGSRHHEQFVDIAYTPGTRFDQLVMAEVKRQQHLRDDLFPSTIIIDGRTRLVDDNGKLSSYDRLLSIHVHFNCRDVEIFPHSDAWLPFSFDARTPTEAYEINAARLNAAIDDLERFCKRECTDDQHCRYCLMEGGRLDNYRVECLPVGVDPALWWDGR